MVKYKDFRLKAHEVRQLKEDNPKIAEDLEDDAKRWESRALELKKEIAEDISIDIQQYFIDYKKENQAELGKAVKTLVDFISKGGDVDCVISNEVDENWVSEEIVETMRLLKEDFAEIRQLKETLLLEHNEDIDES